MNRITLYRVNTGWIADMRETPDASEIRSLFGTDQIPTPFTIEADADLVRLSVAGRNPLAIVVVR